MIVERMLCGFTSWLGRRIDGAAGSGLVAGDRGDVDHVAALLRDHGGQRRRDPVQHALDVGVDHALPFLDVQSLQERAWHQTGVVDDDVDAAVLFHGALNEALDLRALRHVRLQNRAVAEPELFGERFEPVDPPRAQNQLRAALRQQARRGLAEAAARSGDHDDLVFNSFGHASSPR
jgi:hypothetical protein